ncbi:Thiamine biosynthesis protein ThiS (fragment) [uncultured delta proteobacterium]|uniref:Thiamine biosynthesis protein ThiS n=1 Tax=uncultured delta proteobacterium TaxID=34034 RepID=A0A212J6B4_9DELT
MRDTQTVLVNGKEHPHMEGMTVTSLLSALPGVSGNVVVEVNAVIIPRGRFGETLLNAGDRIEIVHFVGGG